MTTAYSYIRLSSKQQIAGHGRQRQDTAAQEAADQYGWRLSDKTFHDLGVSGWKGANVETGALSQFLRLVEEGVVLPGSVLIVENVDRLSRAGVNKAVRLLLELLESGISIYTVSERKLYSPQADNPLMDLMQWALSAQRAHEESEVKSARVKQAKRKAQEEAREKGTIVTALGPQWLTLRPDRSGFDLVPERVEAVQLIFDLYLAGYGSTRIARELTQKGYKPLRGKAWYSTSVLRLINSRLVLGEFQPLRDGKPYGDPIPNYYPAIIDEGRWLEAQAIKGEGGAGKGRRAVQFDNVLSGVVRCGCGQGTHIHRTTTKGKEYKSIRCVQYSIDCKNRNWAYQRLLIAVVWGLQNSSVERILVKRDDVDLMGLQSKLMQDKAALAAVVKQVNNVVDAITTIGINADLQERLGDLTAKRQQLEVQVATSEAALAQAEGSQAIADQGPEELRDAFLQVWDMTKTEEGRIKVNQILRRYLSAVVLHPAVEGADHNVIEILAKDASVVCRLTVDKGFKVIHMTDRPDGKTLFMEIPAAVRHKRNAPLRESSEQSPC
ncbi:recombinase family protein [Ferrimonas balearica]|uniref:recombinase family protein n=1 Tax=Ferrimonas balearica TaxID=44012 RepID=UPI001C5B2FEA|nr:recombinase family protein [Ferrimonas balearica]MBW3166316.1 recombinase family protein [Ferrimonas balearica]